MPSVDESLSNFGQGKVFSKFDANGRFCVSECLNFNMDTIITLISKRLI